jgi:hypothetical protein
VCSAIDAFDFPEVEDALGQLFALEAAVRCEILRLLPHIDTDAEPWRVDGASSLDGWLATRFGIGRPLARELVVVARRLETMPDLAEAFSAGRLSWDQLRFAVRAETDADDAVGMTPDQLQRAARLRERVRECTPGDVRRRRSLRFWNDHASGMVRMSGAFAPCDGETVRAAVTRLAEQAPKDPDTGVYERFESRCADALAGLCSATIADDADADRATVVIHVNESALEGRNGVAETANGMPLSLETIRRRLCDARWQTLKVDEANNPIGIGRTSQSVPPSVRRIVRHRDGGRCRFPGCERTRLVEIHHLWHWEQGGPTDADNLACLCRFHHHLAHEGGWTVRGHPDGHLEWRRPDGTPLDHTPPPLRAEIRARLDELRRAA